MSKINVGIFWSLDNRKSSRNIFKNFSSAFILVSSRLSQSPSSTRGLGRSRTKDFSSLQRANFTNPKTGRWIYPRPIRIEISKKLSFKCTCKCQMLIQLFSGDYIEHKLSYIFGNDRKSLELKLSEKMFCHTRLEIFSHSQLKLSLVC